MLRPPLSLWVCSTLLSTVWEKLSHGENPLSFLKILQSYDRQCTEKHVLVCVLDLRTVDCRSSFNIKMTPTKGKKCGLKLSLNVRNSAVNGRVAVSRFARGFLVSLTKYLHNCSSGDFTALVLPEETTRLVCPSNPFGDAPETRLGRWKRFTVLVPRSPPAPGVWRLRKRQRSHQPFECFFFTFLKFSAWKILGCCGKNAGAGGGEDLCSRAFEMPSGGSWY